MSYQGSERSTRRAVAEVKQAWQAGRRRRDRPWVPEPGMWLQWDWGEGPQVRGRRMQLFCAWLGLVPISWRGHCIVDLLARKYDVRGTVREPQGGQPVRVLPPAGSRNAELVIRC
jgi:hypothetical protein